jgi:hypothetical protein
MKWVSLCQLAKIGRSHLSNKTPQQLIWHHHVLKFIFTEKFHNKSETFSNRVKWKVCSRFELCVICNNLFSSSSLFWHDWTTRLTFNETILNSLQQNSLQQLKLIMKFEGISDIFIWKNHFDCFKWLKSALGIPEILTSVLHESGKHFWQEIMNFTSVDCHWSEKYNSSNELTLLLWMSHGNRQNSLQIYIYSLHTVMYPGILWKNTFIFYVMLYVKLTSKIANRIKCCIAQAFLFWWGWNYSQRILTLHS